MAFMIASHDPSVRRDGVEPTGMGSGTVVLPHRASFLFVYVSIFEVAVVSRKEPMTDFIQTLIQMKGQHSPAKIGIDVKMNCNIFSGTSCD